MSLAELIPLVNNLNPSDQVSLFKILAIKIPNAELQAIFSALEYPIWSPYDAIEASDILLQMIRDDQEVPAHV